MPQLYAARTLSKRRRDTSAAGTTDLPKLIDAETTTTEGVPSFNLDVVESIGNPTAQRRQVCASYPR